MSDLTADIALTRICGQRDLALSKMDEAIVLLERGHELAEEARKIASDAASGRSFHLVDRSQDSDFGRLFKPLNGTASAVVFRKHTDAAIWMHLLKATGLDNLMDAHAQNEFFKSLSSNVPEITEDNILATLEGFHEDRHLIFARGLARTFSSLDKRFKSHDAFKIGARMVITRVFDGHGMWNYYTEARKTISDVERTLAVLDGQAPMGGELCAAVDGSRHGYGPRQGVHESRYLRIRTFKNGNAHLWFTRKDLVEKANLVLAEYYGEVLPDAVGPDETFEQAVSKCTALSKDLQFYATPPAVVAKLLADLYVPKGGRVLEPSAGEGAICRGVLDKFECSITAAEVDPTRAAALRRIDGLWVCQENFLTMQRAGVFDAVVMNPPFYGTHWMQHVTHAFSMLRPGGQLRAVLPVTAEIGDSAKHRAFRKWATERVDGYGRLYFTSLPSEAFASSGTRINTVILCLKKPPASG